MRAELKNKQRQKAQRTNRVRTKVRGTSERPRLSIYRSNRFYYAQIINDETGQTLASANTAKSGDLESMAKDIAKQANSAGVNKVVLDRGGLIYTGNLAKLADLTRAAGLEF